MEKDRLYQIGCMQVKDDLTVAEWAETHRYMQNPAGLFSYAMSPFFREPCESLSDLSSTYEIILKCPSQIGKTESILNMLGWICYADKAPTLLILDTAKSGIRMSKTRIRPFLRETCGINNPSNALNKDPDRSNEVTNIGLGNGANLMIGSAKSATDLCSMPIKYLLCDELDRWETDLKNEGSPLELARQRQLRYRGMALLTSTPTTKDGLICQNFMTGTQQSWVVVCKSCGSYIPCRWGDLDFSGDIPTVSCPKCGEVFSEKDIKNMEHCYTPPKNENPAVDRFGRVCRSFEVFGTLCHSFYTWDYLKKEEMKALSLGESSYRSFRNTRLAETYEPSFEYDVQAFDLIRSCALDYNHNHVPNDVAFIIGGMDTHEKGLYLELVGVSEDCQRYYGIEYMFLIGDPHTNEPWAQLWEQYNRKFIRDDGLILQLMYVFGDSGGHRTNDVYLYSIQNPRFRPIKGRNAKTGADPLLDKLSRVALNGGVKGKVYLQILGVNAGKDALRQMEIETIAGNKRMFYPSGYGYKQEYYDGLLTEKCINGKWVAPKTGHVNNEPLDCRVYSLACAEYYKNTFYNSDLENGLLSIYKTEDDNIVDQEVEMPRKKLDNIKSNETVTEAKSKAEKPKKKTVKKENPKQESPKKEIKEIKEIKEETVIEAPKPKKPKCNFPVW